MFQSFYQWLLHVFLCPSSPIMRGQIKGDHYYLRCVLKKIACFFFRVFFFLEAASTVTLGLACTEPRRRTSGLTFPFTERGVIWVTGLSKWWKSERDKRHCASVAVPIRFAELACSTPRIRARRKASRYRGWCCVSVEFRAGQSW